MLNKDYSILNYCSCDVESNLINNVIIYTFYYKVNNGIIIDVREFNSISKGLAYLTRLDRKLKKYNGEVITDETLKQLVECVEVQNEKL